METIYDFSNGLVFEKSENRRKKQTIQTFHCFLKESLEFLENHHHHIFFETDSEEEENRREGLIFANFWNNDSDVFGELQHTSASAVVNFLSESHENSSNRLQLILPDMQSGNDTMSFHKFVTVIDELLEHRCITETGHKTSSYLTIL